MESEVGIRLSNEHDLDAIAAFGAAVVPAQYEPIIGSAAAEEQVDLWWSRERLEAALSNGALLVAEQDNQLVGVVEVGTWEADPVIWKLYVHPDRRGRGIGRALLRAAIAELSGPASRVLLEHFAGNQRAAAFYEREGFVHLRTDPAASGPGGKRGSGGCDRVARARAQVCVIETEEMPCAEAEGSVPTSPQPRSMVARTGVFARPAGG